MIVPETIQFSRNLHLSPPFRGSLICLPERKQLQCRHFDPCYLWSEVQVGRQLADQGSVNSQQQRGQACLLSLWNSEACASIQDLPFNKKMSVLRTLLCQICHSAFILPSCNLQKQYPQITIDIKGSFLFGVCITI